MHIETNSLLHMERKERDSFHSEPFAYRSLSGIYFVVPLLLLSVFLRRKPPFAAFVGGVSKWLDIDWRVVCVVASGDQQPVSWPPGMLFLGGTAGLQLDDARCHTGVSNSGEPAFSPHLPICLHSPWRYTCRWRKRPVGRG